ncbi:CZB domain-containing protein [Vibrio coralliilyticus]|uniref:CZB domain-containing protein n=2 Tax=Vibrio coralliilyticus TaxID=190893 RepID=UPI003F56B702
MIKVIHDSAAISFLDTVKMDHMVWKNEVYKQIVNQDYDTSINHHTECRLGKWYFEGTGQQKYKHLDNFKLLDLPHKKVHDSGHLALEFGKKKDVEKMLEQLNEMEQASSEVIALIEKLKSDIQNIPYE